ncbi:hybrid sensor histidine kinase/response regulator [Geminicoccus roseus]|uniref:hybrid sensor histidine kinase/response regulator n=1 Tax=Geminicoccus roseus TaxID=404900 RepID=UPI000427E49F|nr:ATP-binding protein [Geminicoccus roseus]
MTAGKQAAALIRLRNRLVRKIGNQRPAKIGLLVCLASCVIGTLAASSVLLRDRDQILHQARNELNAISFPAAGFVARGLVTLDLAVSLAIDEFARGQLDLPGVYFRLRQQAEQIDQLEALRGVAAIDADGIIRYTSDVTRVGYDVRDSSYFTRQRDGVALGMLVGSPVVSRIAPDQEIVPVSWPLHDQNGRFAGVIAVGASWRLYAEIFASLTSAPEQTVALTDAAGRLYAMDKRHWPDLDQEPPRPSFLDAATLPGGNPDGTGLVQDHLVARASVAGFGLQVVTGIPVSTLLQAWWSQVYLAGILIVMISLITGFLTGLLHRTMQTLRATATTAQAAEAEARIAQGHAEAGERSKTQFLAAMSHEIRTPMTGVLGMADLLAAERLDPRQRRYVRAIQTSGQHLMSVINDILDFSRFGAGAITLEHIDFSLPEVLEQVRSIMAPQAADRGLRLHFDLDEHSPPVVRGDPTRLRQILVNLIGNGLKFTSVGGVDVITRCAMVGEDQARFRFEVRDTGIGIPQDRQRELFQAFTQADRSTARKFGGSGLGLAICRQIVTAMGGTIDVESTPGLGSVFSFELVLEVGAIVLVDGQASFDPATIEPLRILVAEDVAVNRDLLQATLTRYGHKVAFAENGEQAVALAQAQSFDVVLMDVQMPTMDGIEAARRIRAMSPPVGTLPIVALTANVMDAERQRCLAAGMNGILTKPVDWEDLFKTLGTIARQSRALRQPTPLATSAAASTAPSAPEPQSLPQPESEPELAAQPDLLDHERINGLRAMAGPDKLNQFLRNALASAEQLTAEVIEHGVGDLAGVARSAHRLAGTAPSFGLRRIGMLGREIEERALRGDDIAELVGLLQQAVAATRVELDRLDLVTAPP